MARSKVRQYRRKTEAQVSPVAGEQPILSSRPGTELRKVADTYESVQEIVERMHLDKVELLEALELRSAAARLRTERGETLAASMLETASSADFDLIDPVPVERARRQVSLRQRLLATPVYTYETLGEVRGDAKTSTTRTWVGRQRGAHLMFTVNHAGRTLIPAFQLTDEAKPRRELVPLLDDLLGAGVDGWDLWVWLTSPTPLLSGGVPDEVVRDNGARALKAASRFAARARSESLHRGAARDV